MILTTNLHANNFFNFGTLHRYIHINVYIYIYIHKDIQPHTYAYSLNCHLSAHRWGWQKFYTFYVLFFFPSFSGAKLEQLLFHFCLSFVVCYWNRSGQIRETNRTGLALICDFNAPPLIQTKPSPLIAVKCWRLPHHRKCPPLWFLDHDSGVGWVEPLSRTLVGIMPAWAWIWVRFCVRIWVWGAYNHKLRPRPHAVAFRRRIRDIPLSVELGKRKAGDRGCSFDALHGLNVNYLHGGRLTTVVATWIAATPGAEPTKRWPLTRRRA